VRVPAAFDLVVIVAKLFSLAHSGGFSCFGIDSVYCLFSRAQLPAGTLSDTGVVLAAALLYQV
jgi:hypothetical protein